MDDQERGTDVGIFIQYPASERFFLHYNMCEISSIHYSLMLPWFSGDFSHLHALHSLGTALGP